MSGDIYDEVINIESERMIRERVEMMADMMVRVQIV